MHISPLHNLYKLSYFSELMEEVKELIAPLRIDLAGGWIDVPEFAQIFPGYVVNAAIRPHIWYTQQRVDFGVYKQGGGIASSTGAIMLHSLKSVIDHSYLKKVHCTSAEFAESIFRWENAMINFRIGRQDPYAIALGGINCLRFGDHGWHATNFEVETHIDEKTPEIEQLEKSLLLVHSGIQRQAQNIVEVVRKNVAAREKNHLKALRDIAQAGIKATRAVQKGHVEKLAEIMSENWDAQKRFAPESTSPEIDAIYNRMLQHGARGGKLCGASGGGYFVFYCDDREQVKKEAESLGLQVIVPEFEMKNILTLNGLNPENPDIFKDESV